MTGKGFRERAHIWPRASASMRPGRDDREGGSECPSRRRRHRASMRPGRDDREGAA